MVSQFVSPHAVPLLHQLNYPFPEGTHAVGRLDRFSEGLLLLTTNQRLTRLLFHPEKKHKRVYAVNVNGIADEHLVERIRSGIEIRIHGGAIYHTVPYHVDLVTEFNFRWKTNDDRKIFGPSIWLEITLTEGKYHQVRKMVKEAGRKCLRLVRVAIENVSLDGMKAGEVKEISEEELFDRLGL